MKTKNLRYLLLTIAMGFVGVLLLVGMMDVFSALAHDGTGFLSVQRQPPPPSDDDLKFIAFFTDDLAVSITDLSGNVLGEGVHTGKVRCVFHNCSQKTQVSFTSKEYEYKFDNLVSRDSVEKRVVMSGSGTISNDGKKENFSFSATFQDNQDGTLSVTYIASNPEASFVIPITHGSMSFRSR